MGASTAKQSVTGLAHLPVLLLEDSRAPVNSAQRSNTSWTNPRQLQEHVVCADVDGGLPRTSCHILHANNIVNYKTSCHSTPIP